MKYGDSDTYGYGIMYKTKQLKYLKTTVIILHCTRMLDNNSRHIKHIATLNKLL